MLDVTQLSEFQRDALGKALAGIEQPPPEVLPAGEQFWRGIEAGLRVHAAALGMDQDAIDWVANEFLRRMRDVPWCPPERVRKKEAPMVIGALYHTMSRKVFEALCDFHASVKKDQDHG
jgi:hypothetical protein